MVNIYSGQASPESSQAIPTILNTVAEVLTIDAAVMLHKAASEVTEVWHHGTL